MNSDSLDEPAGIRKLLVQGGAISTVYWFAGIFLGLATQGLLARSLGQSNLGSYFLLVSLEGIVILILSLGVDKYCIRLIAADDKSPENFDVFRSVIKTLVIVSIFSLVFLFAFSFFVFSYLSSIFSIEVDSSAVVFLCLWYFSSTLSLIAAECFRGLRKIGIAGLLIGPLRQGILFCSILGWLQYGDALSLDLVVKFVAGIVTVQAAIFLALALYLIRGRSGERTAGAKEILTVGLPIAGVFLISLGNREFDIWIVGLLLDSSDVALYGAAMRLNRFVSFAAVILNSVLPPIIVSLYVAKRLSELEDILRATILVSTAAACAVLLAYLVAGDRVLTLIYGEGYSQAHSVLVVLGVGKAIGVMAGGCGLVLTFTNRQALQFKLLLVTLVLNLVLQFVLINIFGLIGAASAATFTMIIQNVALNLLVRKELGIQISLPRNPIAAIKHAKTIFLSGQ